MPTNPASVSEKHRLCLNQLDMPPRLLLGPGPSNAHPRVLQAISSRQVGHLDPRFIELMNESDKIRRVLSERALTEVTQKVTQRPDGWVGKVTKVTNGEFFLVGG